MVSNQIRKIYFPLFLIFFFTGAFCLIFRDFLKHIQVDYLVVSGANTLLFILVIISMLRYQQALQNPNPNVFIRSVMGMTILKLMIIAGAVFIYLELAGANKSLPAVICGMLLYLVYTFAEVRNAFWMNKHTDAGK